MADIVSSEIDCTANRNKQEPTVILTGLKTHLQSLVDEIDNFRYTSENEKMKRAELEKKTQQLEIENEKLATTTENEKMKQAELEKKHNDWRKKMLN